MIWTWSLTSQYQLLHQFMIKSSNQGQFWILQEKLIQKLPLIARFNQELEEILTVKEKASIFNPFGCMMVLFHLRGMSMSDQHDMTSFYHVTSSLATDGVPLNTDVGSHSLLEPDSLPGTGELTTCKWKILYFSVAKATLQSLMSSSFNFHHSSFILHSSFIIHPSFRDF